jgi:hypothetical protein
MPAHVCRIAARRGPCNPPAALTRETSDLGPVLLRRLLAFVMLLALAVSASESVLGELRDGEVHHESSAAAAAHGLHASGEHGHEDGSPPGHPADSGHRHGPGHHHGTGADHCTHQHGIPLPASFAFDLPLRTLPQPSFEPQVHTARVSTTLFRPPRA